MPDQEKSNTNAQLESQAIFALERGWIAVAIEKWTEISHIHEILVDHPKGLGLEGELMEARLLYLAMQQRSDHYFDLAKAVRKWIDEKASASHYSATLLEKLPLALPDSLIIGAEAIDDDHRQLVGRLNQIGESLQEKNGGQIEPLVQSFVGATRAHFTNEEKFLASVGHPGLAGHSHYHDALAVRADELALLVAEMVKGDISRHALFQALANYLFNDPVVADVELRPFFQTA
jgi:hemerythrin-like metal-binding protein